VNDETIYAMQKKDQYNVKLIFSEVLSSR